jgi:hypothetical protein
MMMVGCVAELEIVNPAAISTVLGMKVVRKRCAEKGKVEEGSVGKEEKGKKMDGTGRECEKGGGEWCVNG